MNKLFLLLCFFVFLGCEHKTNVIPKYNVGDVLYIKVNGQKAIITSRRLVRNQPLYRVHYSDLEGEVHYNEFREYEFTKTDPNQ